MIKHILTLLLGFTITVTFAQRTAISGMVNDKQGKPIAFAFVKDAQTNYATFSDTYGAFNMKVDSADRLIVSAPNFKAMVVKVTDPQNVTVVLAEDGTKSVKAISTDAFRVKSSTEDGMTRNVATGYI